MKTCHLFRTVTAFVLAQMLLVTATPIALSPATGPHVVARGIQESSVQTQQHIDPMNGALLEARVSQDEPLADKWKYCREAALPPSLSKVFLSRRGSLQLVTRNRGDEILVYLPLTTDSKATDEFRNLIKALRAAFMTQPNKNALGQWLIHQEVIREYDIPRRPYRETTDKPEEKRIHEAIQSLHDYQGKFALSQSQHKWEYDREAGLYMPLSNVLLSRRRTLLTRNSLVVIFLPLETDLVAVASFMNLVEKLRAVFRHLPHRKAFNNWLSSTGVISRFGIPPRKPGEDMDETDELNGKTMNEGIQAVYDYQQKFVELPQSLGDTRNAS